MDHHSPAPDAPAPQPLVAAVVIGRNEGARLIACLDALQGQVARLIYVDSGSRDGSQQAARARGAEVLALDLAQPFTAARARNAGLQALSLAPPDFVLFLDGDCILQPGFLPAALRAFARHPKAVVICGRRREIAPEASIYNQLCDLEWNTPLGEARACGGDALMLYPAIAAVGGYRADLIAGEEPELCQRLRRSGGQIWRIDAEMTLHDADMHRFGQWWRRARRAGFAFAEGAALHGAGPDRHWRAERNRALLWGLILPIALLALMALDARAGFGFLIYPAQILRLWHRSNLHPQGLRLKQAFFTTLGKFPEAAGALRYYLRKALRLGPKIIEYK